MSKKNESWKQDRSEIKKVAKKKAKKLLKELRTYDSINDSDAFVVYTGPHEVLVTTYEKELDMLFEFFTLGGRVVEDYDRTPCRETAIEVTSVLRAY